mmetsp:Transcript_78880/g.223201  ORF Transcript_78880/g.223201 Transcript_78880/m.223201 type:complete len:222 (+) Transcript_78880:37-702(+)
MGELRSYSDDCRSAHALCAAPDTQEIFCGSSRLFRRAALQSNQRSDHEFPGKVVLAARARHAAGLVLPEVHVRRRAAVIRWPTAPALMSSVAPLREVGEHRHLLRRARREDLVVHLRAEHLHEHGVAALEAGLQRDARRDPACQVQPDEVRVDRGDEHGRDPDDRLPGGDGVVGCWVRLFDDLLEQQVQLVSREAETLPVVIIRLQRLDRPGDHVRRLVPG